MTSHHRHDSSGMGLSANPSLNLPTGHGRMSQGSGRPSHLMNPGSTSKFSHQDSHGMWSTNSSQGLPPIFGHGNRPAPPSSSQPKIEPDDTSKILASFGLSSKDLDELSRYPVEKITPKNLPKIILDLKKKRSEEMAKQNLRERPSREPLRVSSDDTRPFRRDHFNDRSSGLDTVVDYGHGSRYGDPAYRDRLEFEGRLRERERLRGERFRSDASYHKVDNDYKRMGFSQSQERSMHEQTSGMPYNSKVNDLLGVPPKGFPYLCSLCDIQIVSQQHWNDHVKGRAHSRQRLQQLQICPEWTGPVLDYSHTLQQSTNAAAEVHVGVGPKGGSGGHMGSLGTGDVPGPSHMKKRKGPGRVILVKGFEKGKRLTFELLKLANPFGVISNYLIINDKNEALIEMSTPEEAIAIRDYYRAHPAIVLGKRVAVFISQKFKSVKKPDGKADEKTKPKPGFGSVVHLTNLPVAHYSNEAVTKLAEAYGKVKTYILMRLNNEAFIEMEKLEDANTMVEQCAKVPLMFKGSIVNVEISSRYKNLVINIPNKKLKQNQKNKQNRMKRSQNAESGDGENTSSQMVATEDDCQEETDSKNSVTDSCEPELEDETAALMKTSSSVGDGVEMADTSEIDMKDLAEEKAEAQGLKASTPIAKVTDDKKKKPDVKADQKPKPKSLFGRVLHLRNVPSFGYANYELINLAKAYGKVKTYILARVKRQCYIEMEKMEDATTMVQRCAEKPLLFYGKRLKVDICKMDEKLVPNTLKQLQKEYNRKRPHSPDRKNGAKQKQRKMESRQKGESSEGENKFSTEEAKVTDNKKKMAHHYPGDIEVFVTVDDSGDEEAEQENEAVAQQEPEIDDSPMTPESECAAESECPKDLGPFKPNNPVGVDYVVPGFYCTLCSLFYTCEDVAKLKHCRKLSHYKKLQKAIPMLPEVPEKKN
ncbi:matrin-3-like [Pseudophryne corroboree]|uniref:matrin-3-like n=1 Tax=Pseudophryne corroboree TaxID=495146 RepID=UPI0030816291